MSSILPRGVSGVFALLPCAATPLVGQAASPARSLTGFTLIDGTGRAPMPNAAMVVRNGRIVAIDPAARIRQLAPSASRSTLSS